MISLKKFKSKRKEATLSKHCSLKGLNFEVVNQTHSGQAAASERKRRKRNQNSKSLLFEASQLGISIETLKHQKYQEGLPFKRIAAAISRVEHMFGYYR